MPVKQIPGGKWKVVKKDGKLGKTAFNTKSAAQSRARGPGKKGAKRKGKAVAKRAARKPAKRRSSSKSATSSSPQKIGTGRGYQGVRLTMLVLSPATDQAFAIQAGGQTVSGALTQIGHDVQARPYLSHLGIVAADVAIDTNPKVGQAAALSRGSITAWAPEVYIAAMGVEDWRTGQGARQIHGNAILRQTGYNPADGSWDPARMRTYRTIKHGGQVIRYAGSHIKMAERLKRRIQESFLRPLDLTL